MAIWFLIGSVAQIPSGATFTKWRTPRMCHECYIVVIPWSPRRSWRSPSDIWQWDLVKAGPVDVSSLVGALEIIWNLLKHRTSRPFLYKTFLKLLVSTAPAMGTSGPWLPNPSLSGTWSVWNCAGASVPLDWDSAFVHFQPNVFCIAKYLRRKPSAYSPFCGQLLSRLPSQ